MKSFLLQSMQERSRKIDRMRDKRASHCLLLAFCLPSPFLQEENKKKQVKVLVGGDDAKKSLFPPSQQRSECLKKQR